MKTPKRIILAVVALALAPTGLRTQAQDLVYAVTNGAVTITQYTGTGGVVAIPSEIDGLPVTTVGEEAFAWNWDLTRISIPIGVTQVGARAFAACSSLASVTFPVGLTSIGDGSFLSCTNLRQPDWFAVGTATLTEGAFQFSDADWTNHPGRFYRVRSL